MSERALYEALLRYHRPDRAARKAEAIRQALIDELYPVLKHETFGEPLDWCQRWITQHAIRESGQTRRYAQKALLAWIETPQGGIFWERMIGRIKEYDRLREEFVWRGLNRQVLSDWPKVEIVPDVVK